MNEVDLAEARRHYRALLDRFEEAKRLLHRVVAAHEPSGRLREGIQSGYDWSVLVNQVRARLEDWQS